MSEEPQSNLTLLTDFYELTMANGYFENGWQDKIAYFDMFFRKIPDDGGFAIMAGVAQLIRRLENLTFTAADIDFLARKGMFSRAFLHYLQNFRFHCDVWAVPEGTPVFPNEPIVIVRGPVIEAQFIETMVLLTINHQSLIATKANRIVRAAEGRGVMEFGSRRAQGADGANLGARAAYIGGCIGTACTITERDFGVPALGTMAHSWVQMFPTELDAFRAYAAVYPGNCTLLVDTYHVLQSGVPNAIRAFNEEVVPRGFRPRGIRIDSGDIAYLSREARRMLDAAGFSDCQVVASNSLDEYAIRELLRQGARVDLFGVGERLITASSEPVFGGVYKLVAIEDEDGLIPKIKLSENVGKTTNPGYKKLWRLFNRGNGQAMADVISLADETVPVEPLVVYPYEDMGKKGVIRNFRAQEILDKVFDQGKCIYDSPDLKTIQTECRGRIAALPEKVLRLEKPQRYQVYLTQQLWDLRRKLTGEYAAGN